MIMLRDSFDVSAVDHCRGIMSEGSTKAEFATIHVKYLLFSSEIKESCNRNRAGFV